MPGEVSIRSSAISELFSRASDACFFSGVGDLGETLSRTNMAYGIAKIRWVQEQLGMVPDASFVSAPDATITRNIDRWRSGFGYGGRLRHRGDFVVLDIKSNACGLFLGRFTELPEPEAMLARIRDLSAGESFVQQTATSWDFGLSNHFVHVMRFEKPIEGSPYGVLCHGSGPELRSPGPWGPGLYVNRSPRLAELSRTEETPWGPLRIIAGREAVAEYWQGYLAAERHSHERRRKMAEALFPDLVEVSNLTHQGALAPNDYLIGGVAEVGDAVVPLALRAELPVYLLSARPSFSNAAQELLGFGERAARMGLSDVVSNANVLPHGGGYSLPGYKAVDRVLEFDHGKRIYVMEVAQGTSARAYHDNFRHVPFDYRGEEVLRRVEELDMGEVTNRGLPLYEFMV